MIFVTFREYFLGKKLSFVEMAILCLSGRAIPRVLSESLPAERALWHKWAEIYEDVSVFYSESLPAERAFWTFQVFKSLSDFPIFQNVSTTILIVTAIKNYSTRNLKIFLRNLVDFFIYFFENFTLPFVLMYITISISISKIKNIFLKIFTSTSLEIT